MGKGIAKDFKFFFPEMFHEYQLRCENKTIDIGKLYLYRGVHKWVLSFPTKKHWRQPSKVEYVESGLKAFVRGYARAGITTIAFPRLGCGNGELNWEKQVRPLMEKHLARLPIDVFIHHVYKGSEQPEHKDIECMKAWLRSEPESLSFAEVWDDLVALLGAQKRLASIGDGQPFTARIVDAPETGLMLTNGESVFVSRDSLLEIWQCLRSAGFVSAESLVDGLDVRAGQIMAILDSLEYVQATHISQPKPGKVDEFKNAIQFLPRRGDEFDLESSAPQTIPS
jgi:hypothetical protein